MPVSRYLIAFAMIFLGLMSRVQAASDDGHDFLGQFAQVQVIDPPVRMYDVRLSVPGDGRYPLLAYQGGWVLLNVWATWCAPCVAELPKLDQLAAENNGKRLRILAVSVDRKLDAERVAYHLDRWGIETLPPLHDDQRILESRVPVRTLPVTVAINRDGYAVAVLYGAANWEQAGHLAEALARDIDVFKYYGKKTGHDKMGKRP